MDKHWVQDSEDWGTSYLLRLDRSSHFGCQHWGCRQSGEEDDAWVRPSTEMGMPTRGWHRWFDREHHHGPNSQPNSIAESRTRRFRVQLRWRSTDQERQRDGERKESSGIGGGKVREGHRWWTDPIQGRSQSVMVVGGD